MTRCLNPRWQCLNPTWQNSRWLSSSSWIRMNEWSFFSAKWLNWRWQNSRWLPHQVESEWMSLRHIQLVWVRVRVEWEYFWVNLREDDKVFESKMAVSESNMAEFKMAAIIKLSQNEWVKFFFVQNGWIQDGTVQNGCHHQVESEWLSEVFFVQNDWIEDSKIQDDCHHQVKWEWMSLNQIELVWVRVLCKMLQSRWQNSRWLPSSS